jgi:hypothetical protein
LEVRKDLEFWVSALQYVPELDFQTEGQVGELLGVVRALDDELVELDFGGVIGYLQSVQKGFTAIV